jgi:hypothetical protein
VSGEVDLKHLQYHVRSMEAINDSVNLGTLNFGLRERMAGNYGQNLALKK